MFCSVALKRSFRMALVLSLPVALLITIYLVLGNDILAAPMRPATVSDPAINTISIGASLPISDTHPGQVIPKTVYFDNVVQGVITLTFEISGTVPLTFTPGAAFGSTPAQVIANVSPSFAVVTYTVAPDAESFPGTSYRIMNANGISVTMPISYVRDTTKPSLSILNPSTGIFTDTILVITGEASDDGAGVQYVYVSTDGTTWVTATGTTNWSSSSDIPHVDGVPYTIMAYAVDYLGIRSVTSTVSITVDNTVANPIALASTPLTNTWTNTDQISLNWQQATDFSTPVRYYYTLTTSPSCVITASNDFVTTTAVTVPVTSSEIYTFCLRARDSAGNWALDTASLGPFKVDKQPPEGSVTIMQGEYTNQLTITLMLSATDVAPSSGVSQMHVRNAETAWGNWVTYNTSLSWTLSDSDGGKTIEVQYRDGAGNISVTYSDTIFLDRVAPSVDITVPAQLASGPIPVTWSATDAPPSSSGLRYTVEYRKNNASEWSDGVGLSWWFKGGLRRGL